MAEITKRFAVIRGYGHSKITGSPLIITVPVRTLEAAEERAENYLQRAMTTSVEIVEQYTRTVPIRKMVRDEETKEFVEVVSQ